MKKRVISALLALCMACSLAGTAWAEDTAPDATAGAPAPAAQTQSLEEEPEPAESKAASDSASSESTVTSDSASSESTAPSDSASSESTVTSDSTSSESTVTSDSASSESTVTSDSASSSVQAAKPNQAPAASAPEAANDAPATLAAEPRATSNSFHITWSNYFDVTVYYVDQNGSSIEHDFGCKNQTLKNGGSLTFSNFATESTFKTDTGTYTYEGAHYGSYNGDNVTSVSASSDSQWYPFVGTYYYYYFTFSNGQRLTYTVGGRGQESTQTASIYLVYNYEEFQPEELPEDDEISIVETVAQDGMFTAVYNGLNEGDTVTYTWEYSLNGVADTWEPVESQKVTGENFNWRPDDDPQKINVAYDALLRKVSDDQRYFYRVTATVERADGATEQHQAQLQVPYYIQLQNGSFEDPDIPGNQFNEQWPNGKPGLIWQTTGPGSINGRDGDDIEVILENRDGTQENYGVNVAADGEQFAELNCEAYGALYQDVLTVPGTTLNWSFDHLARQLDRESREAQDKMAMVIMPAAQADKVAQDLQDAADTYRDNPQQASQAIQAILDGLKNQPGCYVYEATDSTYDKEGDWQTHKSTTETAYTVPNGQYLTRFFFVSVDAAYDKRGDAVRSKYGTVGNLIDDVWFSTKVPEPDDDEAQLTVRKTVEGLDDLSGYSVTMTVQPEDEGEPARTITFDSSKFTANTDGTYTATTTITYKVAANNGYKKVTVSETQPPVQNYSVESKYTVTGAEQQEGTGTQTQQFTIPARQNATVTFTNTYTPTTTDVTVTKTITGLTDEEEAALVADLTFTLTDTTDSTKTYTTAPGALTLVPGQDGKYTVTIEKVKPGTYTVDESDATVEGYTVEKTISQNATVELNETNTIEVTNAYTPDNNDLSITKKLVAMHGANITDAKDYTFTFTVTAGQGVDPSKLNGKTFTASQEGKEDQAVTFTNGSATVTVTGEGTVTIKNLPLGNYQVREDESSVIRELSGGYFTGSLVTDDKCDPNLTATKAGTVEIQNIYEAYKTLTIKKTVTGEMGTADDWFDFKVTGNNDAEFTLADGQQPTTQDYDFKLNNDGSVTLTHLKQGDTVTVTEKVDKGYKNKGIAVDSEALKEKNPDDGSGHYTIGTAKIDISIPNTSEVNLGTVTFTNEREAVAPTGLESDHNAPFALMVGAAFLAGAALLGNVVLRRRRRWQE